MVAHFWEKPQTDVCPIVYKVNAFRFRGSRVPALRFRNPVSGAKDHAPLPDPEPSPGNRKFFFEAFVLDSWAHSVSVHICIFVHPKVDRISKKSFIFPFYEDVRKKQKHLLLTPG